MENNYAALESQLGNDLCNIEDTEEIFWLKMSDDYQSKVKAGDLLVRQYRFKDAIIEYKNACKIKRDDYMLYIKLGGAYLTLFDFEQAKNCYDNALKYGAKEKSVAFYLGVMDFFKRDYLNALKNFEKVGRENKEMFISVIFWHTIASFRIDEEPTLLKLVDENMDAGHHGAYKTAALIFKQKLDYKTVVIPDSSLDAVIILLGICEYLKHFGKEKEANEYRKRLLMHKEVWPSIAYLAAYNDIK